MGRLLLKAWSLAGVVALLGVTGCQSTPSGPTAQQQADQAAAPFVRKATLIEVQNMHPSPDRPGTVVGEWHAVVRDRMAQAPVQMSVKRREADTNYLNTYWQSDTQIDGLPAGGAVGAVHFGLSRAAGGLTFDGSSDGQLASGVVRFEPESTYAAEIARIYGPVSPDRLFELAVFGFDLSYAQALYEAGYRFTLDEAITQYRNGVSSDYAIELRHAGYELTSGDLTEVHNAGVASSYARQIRQGGLQLSAQELILLNHSGVSADYAIAMRRAGISSSVSDLVFLQHSGVSSDDVRVLTSAGYHLTPEELVKLHRAAINPDYAAALRKAGYSFTPDEMIRLQHAGVDADFAAALVAPGHENLPVDDIIALRQKGLDADTVRKLRK